MMETSKWWIRDHKLYYPTTKTWYCSMCCDIMPVEHNPQWDGSRRGEGNPLEWYVRCDECGNTMYPSEYDCPNCGWPSNDEGTMISQTEPSYQLWAAIELGGNPVTWDETHKCPQCGTEYTFENANF